MSTASPESPDAPGPAAAQRRRFGLRRRAGRSAAEGDTAGDGASVPASQRGGRDAPDPNDTHPDDVPDPHVLGMGLHPLAYEQIKASTDSLVRLLADLAK